MSNQVYLNSTTKYETDIVPPASTPLDFYEMVGPNQQIITNSPLLLQIARRPSGPINGLELIENGTKFNCLVAGVYAFSASVVLDTTENFPKFIGSYFVRSVSGVPENLDSRASVVTATGSATAVISNSLTVHLSVGHQIWLELRCNTTNTFALSAGSFYRTNLTSQKIV